MHPAAVVEGRDRRSIQEAKGTCARSLRPPPSAQRLHPTRSEREALYTRDGSTCLAARPAATAQIREAAGRGIGERQAPVGATIMTYAVDAFRALDARQSASRGSRSFPLSCRAEQRPEGRDRRSGLRRRPLLRQRTAISHRHDPCPARNAHVMPHGARPVRHDAAARRAQRPDRQALRPATRYLEKLLAWDRSEATVGSRRSSSVTLSDREGQGER